MKTIIAIIAKIPRSIAREYKKEVAAFTKLSYADIKAGHIKKYPTIIIKIITKAKATILDSVSSDLDLPIEVYHIRNGLCLNKVSSVKASLRFTVLWPAEKGILKRYFYE